MGDYPQKNRPNWRLRDPRGRRKGEKIKPPEPNGRGFKIGPRCTAAARATGRRCRCVAMQGSSRCNKHGGHYLAYLSEQKRLGKGRVISLISGRAALRKMLAKRGSEERLPPGLPHLASPVDRGYAIEAWENRDLALQDWLDVTRKHTPKPS